MSISGLGEGFFVECRVSELVQGERCAACGSRCCWSYQEKRGRQLLGLLADVRVYAVHRLGDEVSKFNPLFYSPTEKKTCTANSTLRLTRRRFSFRGFGGDFCSSTMLSNPLGNSQNKPHRTSPVDVTSPSRRITQYRYHVGSYPILNFPHRRCRHATLLPPLYVYNLFYQNGQHALQLSQHGKSHMRFFLQQQGIIQLDDEKMHSYFQAKVASSVHSQPLDHSTQ
ncbi:hypothetical protein K440DRAFT_290815 [Wilcoxina mikolae CBS 423.85]|nr:hypothetical protein K440DRAFT_290815 [Wilcoxina mikolae CBS 423.85]